MKRNCLEKISILINIFQLHRQRRDIVWAQFNIIATDCQSSQSFINLFLSFVV